MTAPSPFTTWCCQGRIPGSPGAIRKRFRSRKRGKFESGRSVVPWISNGNSEALRFLSSLICWCGLAPCRGAAAADPPTGQPLPPQDNKWMCPSSPSPEDGNPSPSMATSLHLSRSCAGITLPLSCSHAESVGPDRVACPAPPPSTTPFFNRLPRPRPRPLLSSRKLQTASPPLLLSRTRAVTAESNPKETTEKGGFAKRKYYFVVANAKFLLDEEEHFKEVLFERLRHLNERKKEHDFWLVVEPKFLDKFPSITNRLLRPAVALVSTDSGWISFVKLKLDRVLSAEYEAVSVQEALTCNPTDLHFPPPKKWEAPYPKYEFGWWERFFPPANTESQK